MSIFECKVEGRDECIGSILLAFEMKGAVIRVHYDVMECFIVCFRSQYSNNLDG